MNIGIFIIICVAVLWGLGVFLGAIGGLSKTFTTPPASNLDSSSIQSQEQQTIEDTKIKQQDLMDEMKQKIQDARQ